MVIKDQKVNGTPRLGKTNTLIQELKYIKNLSQCNYLPAGKLKHRLSCLI